MRRPGLVTAAPMLSTALAMAVVALSCDGTHADEGLDAHLRVAGAQFMRGPMPDAVGGPKVQSIQLLSTVVRPGTRDRACSGALEPVATSAALGLSGDPGYWIVPAGAPDVSSPTFPSYKTALSFGLGLGPGRYNLVVRAVDEAGHFGPPETRPLTVEAAPGIAGALVIALTWDSEADLDLHVVTPEGVEISKRNPSSAERPPPGAPPPPPGTLGDGGILDVDSNASCVPDGARAEHVTWASQPPRGHYVVRVDTFSLCTATMARWRVEAVRDGISLGVATGTSTESDTRFSHERGAGVLALEVDVP